MSKPLRSLVLSRFAPHDRAGGAALRNGQNIQALQKLGSVDVITIGLEERSTPVSGIQRWNAFSIDYLLSRRSIFDKIKVRAWPLRSGKHPFLDLYYSGVVEDLIREWGANQYDTAVVEEIALARYIPVLRTVAREVVFDAHNVESVLREDLQTSETKGRGGVLNSLRSRLLRGRMFHEEKDAVERPTQVWACSHEDTDTIRGMFAASAPVSVIPNTIDTRSYGQGDATEIGGDWTEDPLILTYIGSFSYLPNKDAAMRLIQEVLPAVRKKGIPCKVKLVGKFPSDAMIEAARQDADITVTGPVDDVQSYLRERCVITLPIVIGSGTRLKAVEAFAARRPVVSTAKGVEGIGIVDGESVLLRETPEAIAEAAIEIWKSPSLRESLCRNARELVQREYSWESVTQRIAALLRGEVAMPVMADANTQG